MSEFLSFFQLGFAHIMSASALDHILFLIVLAAVYRARDWRDALLVVSAFTIGHSLTLALAVTDTVRVSEPLVEFLIPLTIVAAAAENLLARDGAASLTRRFRPLLAGVFGLVHGAGFAGYLKSMFMDDLMLPLLGFNAGIEVGQVVALMIIAVFVAGLDMALVRVRLLWHSPAGVPVLRARVVGLSVCIGLIATMWSLERRPW